MKDFDDIKMHGTMVKKNVFMFTPYLPQYKMRIVFLFHPLIWWGRKGDLIIVYKNLKEGVILFSGKRDVYDILIQEQHLSQQGQTNWQEEKTKLTFYGWEQQTCVEKTVCTVQKSILYKGYWVSVSGVKRPVCGIDHPPFCSASVLYG
jgi:hypothetical protein